ncbi:hypothetical protein D8M34_17810 [Microbacterium sp. HSID17254]|nr:hypothetical protein D8M34_17810 [Microbacterium sp. HSID17254]
MMTALTTAHTHGLTLASDAILSWPHRCGANTSCLARLRGTRDPAATDRLLLTVVLSELRGQPRGHYVLSDVAGAANSARAQLVPGSVDPGAITWLVHHGDFSSADPTGPESLTRVDLHWTLDRYSVPAWDEVTRLDYDDSRRLLDELLLRPVDEVLAAIPWDIPRPRQDGGDTGAHQG